MNSLQLDRAGLRPLEEGEACAIDGGGIPSYVWSIVSSLVNNWGDVREGLSDGWNGRVPRH